MRRLWIITILLLSACQPVSQTAHGFIVIYHPDGRLYVGDQVSIEVIPPPGWGTRDQQVRIMISEQKLGSAGFGAYGVGQRNQATFWWVWDTKELEAGEQTLSFSILPDGLSWQESIQLYPASKGQDLQAAWATTSTDCCKLAYITGTDAGWDMELLMQMADEQAADVSARLQTHFNQRISITFIPRLLGQGGFSSNGIYVSYLDGNIAGNTTGQVIHHEMVHVLDASLGGELLPSMLVEGLAVYLSGGHFKSEALMPRAAAILELDAYIPLKTLAENFYNQQHEIGYLQAGALVEYMVGRFGWEEYQSFYRHIADLGNQAASLEAALNQHFGISLDHLEQDFLKELRGQVVTEDVRNDLRLTVAFYDSMRHYQQVLDPSAYFLNTWLPDGETMRQKGIVADYLRVPGRLDNLAFEFMLRTANHEVAAENYKQAEIVLVTVNYLLDLYP
ncbi:MAG: hypothetical protein A2X25_04710 [Chloroflexi bacterium GWB2_49_20]|nr:MAG: hypothetical protein A2X25_04710 [Chloroflexi bacterium GWB2_49_20]OGN80489.1 MAG: hypothetical protein A2X26_11820 [Chloroflexi bacterium GWC2_49_37]OGN83324.1 MAG: hypothetical protein A2X27_11995 [Chloroflexi bacterium GWD2_49_16]HCC78188.1 hypothetical protein [Anaerolineae bacterium]